MHVCASVYELLDFYSLHAYFFVFFGQTLLQLIHLQVHLLDVLVKHLLLHHEYLLIFVRFLGQVLGLLLESAYFLSVLIVPAEVAIFTRLAGWLLLR